MHSGSAPRCRIVRAEQAVVSVSESASNSDEIIGWQTNALETL